MGAWRPSRKPWLKIRLVFSRTLLEFYPAAQGMALKAGKLGKIAGVTQKVARAVDPIRLGGKAVSAGARGTGKVASEILGLSTGAQATPFKVAAKVGREGGEKERLFVQSAKGQIPMDRVVEEARSAVSSMHQKKMAAYKEGIAGAFADTADTPIDFNKVMETSFKPLDQGRFKGVNIAKSTAEVRDKIYQQFQQWMDLDPAEFHTVEGMDAFRKSIGDVLDSTKYGTPERKLATEVYFTVRKSIEAQAPGYGKVLTSYHEASKHLKDLERSLSGRPFCID